MRDRMHAHGFTLLEVILAITIGLGLMGAAVGFYYVATQARASVIEESEFWATERGIMDRVTRELRGALVYQNLGMSVRGDSEQMSMVTTRIPAERIWEETVIGDQPPTPELDLGVVEYRLGHAEDEDGNIYVTGIERTHHLLLTEQTVEEGVEVPVAFLTDRFKFLRFQYYDGSAWQDAWPGGAAPMAVRISLGVEPLDEGLLPDEYPYETYSREVYLPVTQLTFQGGLVGPGGGG